MHQVHVLFRGGRGRNTACASDRGAGSPAVRNGALLAAAKRRRPRLLTSLGVGHWDGHVVFDHGKIFALVVVHCGRAT